MGQISIDMKNGKGRLSTVTAASRTLPLKELSADGQQAYEAFQKEIKAIAGGRATFRLLDDDDGFDEVGICSFEADIRGEIDYRSIVEAVSAMGKFGDIDPEGIEITAPKAGVVRISVEWDEG